MKQGSLIREKTPYRETIDALVHVYLRPGAGDIVPFLTKNIASRRIMLDGYNGYVGEGRIEAIENLPEEKKRDLWDMVKNTPGETKEQKTDLARACYFLFCKFENPNI